ncbi:unnamed protein product [Caenorhabditis nigoni]
MKTFYVILLVFLVFALLLDGSAFPGKYCKHFYECDGDEPCIDHQSMPYKYRSYGIAPPWGNYFGFDGYQSKRLRDVSNVQQERVFECLKGYSNRVLYN